MQVITKTHVGNVRPNNEDCLLARPPYLFAVADGMGGYASGEVASRETVRAFEAATYPLRSGAAEDAAGTLQEACRRANEHVYKMARKNENYSGMGTTLTALYLPGDGTAYAAHAGDSRLYLFRGGSLSQVTRDHSYVASLLEQGKISPAEAFEHPRRNMLLMALGVEERVTADILHFALEADDKLLLCSDGLSDMLRNEEIETILQNEDCAAASERLLDEALARGGRDNISFILINLAGKEEASHG